MKQQRMACIINVWIYVFLLLILLPATRQKELQGEEIDAWPQQQDGSSHHDETLRQRQRRRRLQAVSKESYDKVIKDVHIPMFAPVKSIEVIGPTEFPPPSLAAKVNDADPIVPALKPRFGAHRPDQDVVFAYAAEYPLLNYLCFVQSLRNTGYTGDIVLSVSELDLKKKDVLEYLQGENVIIYTPSIVCFNFEHEEVDSAKGGIRTCVCHNLYGRKERHNETGEEIIAPLADPRGQRTIATIRYEIYWILSQQYNKDSWIFVVDARDTYFQSNPFDTVPRKTDPTGRSGLMYYFGENIDATRLGKSTSNRKWLMNSYGNAVAAALEDKPTICSGATMGEQVAMQTYFKAMVGEADETGVVLMGSDQGFHNFLYYSRKLKNADSIHDIVVFDQGTSIVNNMGAMRTADLDTWGNGKIVEQFIDGKTEYRVLNWDGMLSPVVHQFDRHKVLSNYFFTRKTEEFLQSWRAGKKESVAE